jgi:hypothetical protein
MDVVVLTQDLTALEKPTVPVAVLTDGVVCPSLIVVLGVKATLVSVMLHHPAASQALVLRLRAESLSRHQLVLLRLMPNLQRPNPQKRVSYLPMDGVAERMAITASASLVDLVAATKDGAVLLMGTAFLRRDASPDLEDAEGSFPRARLAIRLPASFHPLEFPHLLFPLISPILRLLRVLLHHCT